jgi:hypothetical protein
VSTGRGSSAAFEWEGTPLRRITLLLASAAIAATGTLSASAVPPDSQVCTRNICVCVTTTQCVAVPKPSSTKCLNADIDDNGTYETICLPV